MRRLRARSLLSLVVLLLAGCGGSEDAAPTYDREEVWASLGFRDDEAAFDESLVGLDEVTIDPPPVVGADYHPVFPDPIPFDPADWRTTVPTRGPADPDALKGGRIRIGTASWPPTIRTDGPNAALAFLSDIHDLVYEYLLGYDVALGDYVPGLASHWQIGEDRLTFRFRIDAEARWSDGTDVTADDVVATIEHMQNPDRKAPGTSEYYKELIESARALDRLTVEVKGREPIWDTFLTIAASTKIYPAAYIRMDGETYLSDWNWRLPPGSGPYEVRSDDIKKGRSITLRRRKDWWAADRPANRGLYNFDEIDWQVVREEELMYQKLLKGELDLYQVSRAQRWVDELARQEVIAKGWVQMRKIYNLNPQGFGGYCFNMRQPPFDSRNVRLAFAHLVNREKLFAKFFFYEYEYTDSYYPGQSWARPDAERIRYDPEAARALLAKDGWTRRDERGFLVNEAGERFPELVLEESYPSFQRIHDVVKNDLWREAGISMELKYIDDASLTKKVFEYRYQLVYWSWTASLFPDPYQTFHSKFADIKQTNNLSGFKDPEADRIIEEYRREFDAGRRRELLRRLDRILFDTHIYALGYYGPYFRLIYWDRFGHPPEYAFRYDRDIRNVLALWWYDPVKDVRTAENQRQGLDNYPGRPLNQYDETEIRYWLFNERPGRVVR